MPELPEVEITRLALSELVQGNKVVGVTVRDRRLRWPVTQRIDQNLPGQIISLLQRRAKYLIFHTQKGCLIVHLGMSGSLCVVAKTTPVRKHDHIDIEFEHKVMRFHDPRRFGSFHWVDGAPDTHPLLNKLGVEPLSRQFNSHVLYQCSRGRRISVKSFIMNSHIVVGIGNIYANEALFLAGIDPRRSAGRISEMRYAKLVKSIKTVLKQAIAQGGTSLRDFVSGEGNPGYFQLRLKVYGCAGKPCPNCARPLSCERLAQRASYFCRHCQR